MPECVFRSGQAFERLSSGQKKGTGEEIATAVECFLFCRAGRPVARPSPSKRFQVEQVFTSTTSAAEGNDLRQKALEMVRETCCEHKLK